MKTRTINLASKRATCPSGYMASAWPQRRIPSAMRIGLAESPPVTATVPACVGVAVTYLLVLVVTGELGRGDLAVVRGVVARRRK